MKTKRFMCVFIIMAAAIVFPELSVANGSEQQNLSAANLAQLKIVGNALLRAKRSAKQDEDVSSIRNEIKTAHGLLQSLMISEIQENNQIQLEAPAGDNQTTDTWSQNNAGKIKQLRQIFTSFKNNSRTASVRQKSRIKDSKRHLSNNVVSRLENLENELEDTLLLPQDKRVERLKALALDLELGSQPGTLAQKKRVESPTMTTRTSHRPLGNK